MNKKFKLATLSALAVAGLAAAAPVFAVESGNDTDIAAVLKENAEKEAAAKAKAEAEAKALAEFEKKVQEGEAPTAGSDFKVTPGVEQTLAENGQDGLRVGKDGSIILSGQPQAEAKPENNGEAKPEANGEAKPEDNAGKPAPKVSEKAAAKSGDKKLPNTSALK